MGRASTLSLLSILAAFAITGVNVAAQDAPIIYQPDPDSPIGVRNPKGPEELSQFDFVIGDWDVEITFFPPQGEAVTYNARWHNHWIIDGFVVMQEWRGPYATGAEFRAWDAQAKRWSGRNIYAGKEWHQTHADYVDGKMIVYIEDASDKSGSFINRETYFDIEADSFKMKSDRSYDEGESWEKGRYEMVATRRAE